MSSAPLVSVVIPAKNRRDLLRETLASVAAQTRQDWEAIVVDDGSTDGTEEMVVAIAATEKRIKFFRRDRNPPGAPTCRNIGLALAKGEFILFLDSDDLLAPQCLDSRVRALQSDPKFMFVVGDAERFRIIPGDVGAVFGVGEERFDLIRLLCMHYAWQTAGPLWRRHVFDEMGGWDESLEIGQDVDFGARALIAGFPYRRLHQKDFYYRISPGGVGADSKKTEKQASHLRRIGRFHELLKSRNLLRGKIRAIVAGNYLWIAQNFASAGHFVEAVESWESARRRRLVSPLHFAVGFVLLHSIQHGYVKFFAPLAVFFLPRGFLIYPQYGGIAPGFVDASGQYRPVHCPRGVGAYEKNGAFDYWFWITYPARRAKRWLNGSKQT